MKNIIKHLWLFAIVMLLCGLSADSFAQRGRSSGSSFGRSSYSSPRNYSAPSSSSQMRSGGTMGSGVSSSSSSSSKMRSGGNMNTNLPPVSAPTTNSSSINRASNNSGTSTSYRYRTYSGPRETTYQGRHVYINVNGGYSYYPGGPVIAYMPGYAPVAYVPASSGPGFATMLLIIVGGLAIVALIAYFVNR